MCDFISKLTFGLNDPQKEAVSHANTPLLVLAGAGSGKTKVLTYRIAYLLKTMNLKTSQVLAVTFTNKAANEMKERLQFLLNSFEEDAKRQFNFLYMGTFHSVCVKILRRDGHLVGLEPSFTIYDDNDSKEIIKEVIKEMNLDVKQISPNTVNWIISSAKNSMVTPKEFQMKNENSSELINEQVSKIYTRYQKIIEERNAVDFNDIINKTIALLKNSQSTLSKYKDNFQHILIDEYQDTNRSQYELIKLLSLDKGNITAVGDSDQSIYGWRGADIQNILSFENDYKDSKIIKLEQNYRSTQNILDAADGIISKSLNRYDKKLWSDKKSDNKIISYLAVNENDEAKFIVKEIGKLTKSGVINYKDIAVLIRANAQSRYLEEQFIRGKIPYKLIGGTKFYDRKEIKDIIAYLVFINNPADLLAFTRIINTPPRKLGNQTVKKILEINKRTKTSFIELLETVFNFDRIVNQELTLFYANNTKLLEKPKINKSKKQNLNLNIFDQSNEEVIDEVVDKNKNEVEKKVYSEKEIKSAIDNDGFVLTKVLQEILDSKLNKSKPLLDFIKLITQLRYIVEHNTKRFSDLLVEIVDRIRYIDYISDGTKESEFRIDNLKELLSVGSRYDDITLNKALRKFLEDVALIQNADDENKNNTVSVMTIHAAKGLEFEAVFLPGLEEGIFPHSRSYLDPKEMEEERRLAYVAVTRAKNHLYISYASSREYFGKVNSNQVSRFVLDIPANIIETVNLYSQDFGSDYSKSEGELEDSVTSELYLDVGDLVTHPVFGIGKIIDYEADMVTVIFDSVGKKKLVSQFANLKKAQ